jgi:hypothetical protein
MRDAISFNYELVDSWLSSESLDEFYPPMSI